MTKVCYLSYKCSVQKYEVKILLCASVCSLINHRRTRAKMRVLQHLDAMKGCRSYLQMLHSTYCWLYSLGKVQQLNAYTFVTVTLIKYNINYSSEWDHLKLGCSFKTHTHTLGFPLKSQIRNFNLQKALCRWWTFVSCWREADEVMSGWRMTSDNCERHSDWLEVGIMHKLSLSLFLFPSNTHRDSEMKAEEDRTCWRWQATYLPFSYPSFLGFLREDPIARTLLNYIFCQFRNGIYNIKI